MIVFYNFIVAFNPLFVLFRSLQHFPVLLLINFQSILNNMGNTLLNFQDFSTQLQYFTINLQPVNKSWGITKMMMMIVLILILMMRVLR